MSRSARLSAPTMRSVSRTPDTARLIETDDRFYDARFRKLAIGSRDVVEGDQRGIDSLGRDDAALDQGQGFARVVGSTRITRDEAKVAKVKTRGIDRDGYFGRERGEHHDGAAARRRGTRSLHRGRSARITYHNTGAT